MDVPIPIPPPPPLNLGHLQQLLHNVGDEVGLFQNVQILPAIMQLLLQLQLAAIQNYLNDIQGDIKRIPVRLYNPTLSDEATLSYPPKIAPNPHLPSTKRELRTLSIKLRLSISGQPL